LLFFFFHVAPSQRRHIGIADLGLERACFPSARHRRPECSARRRGRESAPPYAPLTSYGLDTRRDT
jgi:hypothetical protein